MTLLILITGNAFAVSFKDLPQLLSHPENFHPTQQDNPYGDETFDYKQYSWGETLTVFVNQSDPNDRSLWIQTSNVDKIAPKRKLIAVTNDPDATYEIYNVYSVASGGFQGKYLIEALDGNETALVQIVTPSFGKLRSQAKAKENSPMKDSGIFPLYRLLDDHEHFCKLKWVKCL